MSPSASSTTTPSATTAHTHSEELGPYTSQAASQAGDHGDRAPGFAGLDLRPEGLTLMHIHPATRASGRRPRQTRTRIHAGRLPARRPEAQLRRAHQSAQTTASILLRSLATSGPAF